MVVKTNRAKFALCTKSQAHTHTAFLKKMVVVNALLWLFGQITMATAEY